MPRKNGAHHFEVPYTQFSLIAGSLKKVYLLAQVSEFVSMGWRFLEMEGPLAARCPCFAVRQMYVSMHLARLLCHRAGAQVNQRQPLVHALSRTFKQLLSIRHQKWKAERVLTPTRNSAWTLPSRFEASKVATSSE